MFIRQDILGQSDTIGTYVGNDGQETIGKQAATGAFAVYEDVQARVMVRVKLFANSDAPEYLVIVGKLMTG